MECVNPCCGCEHPVLVLDYYKKYAMVVEYLSCREVRMTEHVS